MWKDPSTPYTFITYTKYKEQCNKFIPKAVFMCCGLSTIYYKQTGLYSEHIFTKGKNQFYFNLIATTRDTPTQYSVLLSVPYWLEILELDLTFSSLTHWRILYHGTCYIDWHTDFTREHHVSNVLHNLAREACKSSARWLSLGIIWYYRAHINIISKMETKKKRLRMVHP